MQRKVCVAASTLNQWALDFEGNYARILQSIQEAVEMGAKFRTGPELEISGYSCEDHFLELDTIKHSWEVLMELLTSQICTNIVVDVGMPVMHRGVTYNCRVIFLNGSILLIRPKMRMCNDGNYRESRWFTAWTKHKMTEEFTLPREVRDVTKQTTVPFGDAVLAMEDVTIGFEICEELWNPLSTHIQLGLDGVDIICNSSGSYTELRKAYVSMDLVESATLKAGGLYIFCNLRGCDGERVYFNGNTCIALNGHILNKAKQFALEEVEVITTWFDVDDVRNYRNSIRSLANLAAQTPSYPRITVNFSLSTCGDVSLPILRPFNVVYHSVEEEIALGPACWLWDYLRRSGQGGYFLPLSGGVDSTSCALIVFSMCNLIVEAVQKGDSTVLYDVRRIVNESDYVPACAKELCGRLLATCYMATENSSNETRMRANELATEIGSHHSTINIDAIVSACLSVFTTLTGMPLKFRSQGGCVRQNSALQNVQARVRMVMAYLLAQLNLWYRNRPGGLLVLASANVDEALRGYMTKYDCSSADVNPIGGLSKTDLKLFLAYARKRFNIEIVDDILNATPTAELEPLQDGAIVQSDEADMGITYAELSICGSLRKQHYCGPFSMFCKLLNEWHGQFTPLQIADKVKHFFRWYAINRHKMTVLTPSYHAQSYSPDDNRFDLRPFLYRVNWSWQFKAIDDEVVRLTRKPSTDTPYSLRVCLDTSKQKAGKGGVRSGIPV